MAKKKKRAGRSAKKSAKKALRSAKKHGPLSAAVMAVGGLFSSVLASDKFRQAVQDLVSGVLTRASNTLSHVSRRATDVLDGVRETHDEREAKEHDQAHA